MPAFKAYPTAKEVPSRKQRKAARRKTFVDNKHMTAQYTKRERKAE